MPMPAVSRGSGRSRTCRARRRARAAPRSLSGVRARDEEMLGDRHRRCAAPLGPWAADDAGGGPRFFAAAGAGPLTKAAVDADAEAIAVTIAGLGGGIVDPELLDGVPAEQTGDDGGCCGGSGGPATAWGLILAISLFEEAFNGFEAGDLASEVRCVRRRCSQPAGRERASGPSRSAPGRAGPQGSWVVRASRVRLWGACRVRRVLFLRSARTFSRSACFWRRGRDRRRPWARVAAELGGPIPGCRGFL